MNKATTLFNFEAGAARARAMTDEAIHYALLDIRRTLRYADELDREDDGGRGGYYRDEASVLHAELKSMTYTIYGAPPCGEYERIDEAETRMDAEYLMGEYALAFGGGWSFYIYEQE